MQSKVINAEPFKTCENCINFMDKKNCGIAKGRTKKETLAIYQYRNYEICTDYTRNNKKANLEPNISEALEQLNSKFFFKVPTDTEEILGFDNGYYRPFKCDIKHALEEHYGEALTRNFVDELLAHIQRANYIKRTEVNKFENKIPIVNGLFNLLTREIEPFNSEQVFTYKLNVEYNPEAECPKFLKFLEEILPEESSRKLLQEICGYCLLPAMPFHVLIWFYGIGRNGKGRITATLEYIFGEDNVSNLNLSEFSESRRFALQLLYAKFVNISSEPKLSKYGLQTNVLKLISGEDTIHAELKGKNKRLKFKNTAKAIILGNRFPKVEDNSLGFWDRVIVLNFPNSFEGKFCIPNIERNWIPEEVSGIFKWMLEGLYRLKENGQFSSSKTTEETKAEFMRVSDPFNAWLSDSCTFISEAFLTRQEAYDNYRDYSDELGAEPDSAKSFYQKMRQTPRIKDTRIRIKGKIERVFHGITLKLKQKRMRNKQNWKM